MGSSEMDDLADRDRAARADDEQAAKRDVAAGEADRQADRRDAAAEVRDTAAGHYSVNPERERRRAADDRSHAVEDRRRASQDRESARADRHRAAEDRGGAHDAMSMLKGLLYRAEDDDEVMVLVGQAQGMIMAARDATPLQALLELSARAAQDGTELVAAARAIVRETKSGPPGDS
jgi:hypothetical protein